MNRSASDERTGALDVVGIGSMVVDRVHRAPRILDSDQKGILRDIDGAGPVRNAVGGVVLNHLGWAAALGLRCGIFGRQADDEGGRFLRAAMRASGIEQDLRLDGSASSLAEIFVDDEGARSIYMAPGATSETTAAQIRDSHAPFIRRASRLTTEISQLPLAVAREALAVAREHGIPTVVDFDVPPADALATLGSQVDLEAVLSCAEVLKPAKSAARALFPDSSGDALALARSVRDRFSSGAVVLTDGEAGCAICTEGFEGIVPAFPIKVTDTTGAGDAFLGGLVTGLHLGLGWEACGRLANAAGAACSEQLGAFPENPEAGRARILELYGAELELPPARAESPAPQAGAAQGRAVLEVAASEIEALRRRHDGRELVRAAELIEASQSAGGRVHVTGVGKPAHAAHYAASLLSSTGTPTNFLDAAEALHGSLGQLVSGDVLIAVSNSGETRELLSTAEAAHDFGARIIAVTGGPESSLARLAEVVLDAGVASEGGPLSLAPRVSVAAEVLVLAALGAVVQERAGFSSEDYAARHPAGALGDRARRRSR